MTDYSLALQIKPPSVDVATPLLTAARIRNAEFEQRKNEMLLKQEALGQEFRGLAAVANSPEFPQRWAEAHDRMAQQGFITPQAHAQLRDNPSMLILKQGLAATTTADQALREMALAETTRQHKETTGLEREKLAETIYQHRAAEEKPVGVAPGTQLVNPKTGQPVFSNQTGLMSEEALRPQVEQYLVTGAVPPGLYRGRQGPENVAQFFSMAARAVEDRGLTGKDLAAAKARFAGDLTSARAAANIETKVGYALNELEGGFPLAIKASENVPRTSFVPFNKLKQIFNEQTSSPEQRELYVALQGIITPYSMAIGRGNPVTTVHAQEKAEKLISSVTSHEALVRVIGQMEKEIDVARRAATKTREDVGKTSAAAPAPTKVEYDRPEIVDARNAIARGVPRAKIEERLRAKGIKFEPRDLGI